MSISVQHMHFGWLQGVTTQVSVRLWTLHYSPVDFNTVLIRHREPFGLIWLGLCIIVFLDYILWSVLRCFAGLMGCEQSEYSNNGFAYRDLEGHSSIYKWFLCWDGTYLEMGEVTLVAFQCLQKLSFIRDYRQCLNYGRGKVAPSPKLAKS